MSTQFPDGSTAYMAEDAWPLVTVSFPDGIQVSFRAGSEWPHSADVHAAGLEIKGHTQRYDVHASVDGSGGLTTIPERIGWKTGVNGVDGAGDIPVKVTEHLSALVRRRTREARVAMRTAAGAARAPSRRPAACRYEQDTGDPAVRVCLTHAPDLGLYGDEACASASR